MVTIAPGPPFIKINHLDGTASLYGPAPAGFEEVADDQRFTPILTTPETSEIDVDAYIAQQMTFDPDLWLVEVEDAKKRHFLEGWMAES